MIATITKRIFSGFFAALRMTHVVFEYSICKFALTQKIRDPRDDPLLLFVGQLWEHWQR